MHNPLPQPDLHHEFTSSRLDEILSIYKQGLEKQFPDRSPFSTAFVVDGNINGSDIKWNNFSGKVELTVFDPKHQKVAALGGCQLDCFTGNCGVKAIDHLWVWHNPLSTDTAHRAILEIIESFAYHKLNCGWLIGSDAMTKDYVGTTLTLVQKYGSGYEVSRPTWNPNYNWNKTHTIVLFQKDMNAETHTDYGWG